MRKLFSTLYGSHLYGTATPESDRDLKHIVLPELDSLLLGHVPRYVVKKTNDREGVRNAATDVDEEFVPVQVFARDLLGGQTYAIELAFAIEGTHAQQHIHDPKFRTFVRELRKRFLTSNIKAMVAYSVAQAGKYSFKGDRLRCATEALALYRKFPPGDAVHFHIKEFVAEARKLEEAYPECFAVTEYDADGRGTMKPCVTLLTRTLPFTATFGYSAAIVEGIARKYGDRSKAAASSDADWKATMHAVRILDEACIILSGGTLTFPYPEDHASLLRAIRRGELSREMVSDLFNAMLSNLDVLAAKSELRPSTPEMRDELEVWLLGWLKIFYAGDFHAYSEKAA